MTDEVRMAWAKIKHAVEFHAPNLDPDVAVVAQALEGATAAAVREALDRLRDDVDDSRFDKQFARPVEERLADLALLAAAADAGARDLDAMRVQRDEALALHVGRESAWGQALARVSQRGADAGARAREQAIEECADLIEQTLLDQDIVVLGEQTGDVATIARGIGREMAAALRALLAPTEKSNG